ncbi:glutamate synthase subunit beta [Thermoflavimicrobium dichotomicum]|uniref:Glutamate synthase (NADPH/NADH) small chain n=1 Tax=Thermoflavimicrobium dichotomicum TaxID=46223 RepID=A0A1I3U3L9_9BACL|nr:glutamate synthase subunit beta [Thermoflavimicrobium dichotomicum]SFJ77333.1 glutamate synthase (NADPH/NADH) small chain [Thermoflavimicrobium dichotomicum]
MGKPTGFIEYEREVPQERDPLSRLRDWEEYQLPFPEEKLQQQGARCMDCGTPFCHTGMELNGQASGCPLYNLIPEWNDLVYRGHWKEALERLLKTNNFPEFTGRVCPAPCEGSCTVAIHDPAVAIKSIERAIIDKGFQEGWIVPQPPKTRTGKKVAIVGSGPAGLACADQLNKAGHWVTVFERADRIGGLLMYGIPNMKLEKRWIDRRVDLLKQEGITFVTNTEIGKDISLQELQQKFDAVVLCAGAQKQRDLQIEGRELAGIHFAMDYLTDSTKTLLDPEYGGPYISAEGKDVIVIGGGDTGADCVATALRQKCRSVVQFGKHPRLPESREEDNPWPEYPNVFTLDYAYEEALARFGKDPRQYCIMTKKIVGDEHGHVKELHTVDMVKIRDENGRYTFREIPGSDKVWPAQLVLIAIGFAGTDEHLIKHAGLEHVNLKVKAEYGKYQTNLEGVFVAGDMRRGQSLVVWAIHEGREAARECDKYLMGYTNLP